MIKRIARDVLHPVSLHRRRDEAAPHANLIRRAPILLPLLLPRPHRARIICRPRCDLIQSARRFPEFRPSPRRAGDAERMMTAQPFVSVIIPVYNDAERLRLCLRALARQTYPRGRYEVVVVDNGSDESIEPAVAEFDRASLCREEQPGSYAARNRGLSVARGEVIAFTDADCLPAPEWIERGVGRLLGAPGCGLVAGRVEVFPNDPRRATAVELYEMVTYLQQRKHVEVERFGATANLFTRRAVFERVGTFKGEMLSGGDVEWGGRVAAAGYGMLYAEDAVVAHPARRTFKQLYRRVARIVGGDNTLEKIGTRSLLASLLPPVRYPLLIWDDPKLKSPRDKCEAVCVAFFVRYVQAWEKLRLVAGRRPRR
jgi:glycosyltransferase involved in cell wall biosynthesis